MSAIIIAGEDGVLYRITMDQLQAAHVLDAQDPNAQESRELIEQGAVHAVFIGHWPEGNDGRPCMAKMHHLLNLAAFRKVRPKE